MAERTAIEQQRAESPGRDHAPARLLQRRCACGGTPGPDGECEACKAKRLSVQRQPATPGATIGLAPPIVHEVLRSTGRPLDPAARTRLEPRFGHNFGGVRVHNDARAAESAQAVGALAYTVGRDIVFGAGQYAPGTAAGQRLLAHELAHVVQQRSAGPSVQPQLRIGAVHDAAEVEAERMATQAVGEHGAAPLHMATAPGAPVLRRAPTTPQGVGEGQRRKVTLPTQKRGADQVRVHVLRWFEPCPCRQVSDTRSGIFYNPDLDNLAIAYRRCRGGKTLDVYSQLQSNATAFLQGGAPPTGTTRVGIDINVVGRNVGGRVVIEALGTNESGAGVGGHAQVVFQGGSWRVFLEPQFIRRLQDLGGGQTPNELQLSLGGQIGNVTAKVDLNDLLDPGLRRGKGTICIPAGPVNICPSLEVGGGRGVTPGIDINVPLGGPEVRQERCTQCFCPAPVRKYQCIEDVLPREEKKPELVPQGRHKDYRVYFRLNRTTPSEDAGLRAQSDANLAELASRVRTAEHASLDFIHGYASPEAGERERNDELSQERAKRMKELVQEQVGAGASLPEPMGGGELLGRRPTASPSSRLGDIITANGFRSAEDLSVILRGEEIPNKELAGHFISLFKALPDRADRLAVFGLNEDDPIAEQVLAAVDQFVRGGGRGYRPWERIFRPLRYAVARVSWEEKVKQMTTVYHSGSVRELAGAACDESSRRAEDTGEFGPVNPEALRPTSAAEDSDTDCLIEPRGEDRAKGCKYELPATFRRRASAPDFAPREAR